MHRGGWLLRSYWRKPLVVVAATLISVPGLLILPSMPVAVGEAVESAIVQSSPPDTPKQQTGTAEGLPSLVSTAVTQPNTTQTRSTAAQTAAEEPKGAMPVDLRAGVETAVLSVGYCSDYPQYSQSSTYSAGSQVWWVNPTGFPSGRYVYRANVYVPMNQNPSSDYYENVNGTVISKPYWSRLGECTDAPPDPEYPPSLTAVFPLNGMLIGSRTPLLGAEAHSNDGGSVRFAFKVCTNAARTTGCVASGTLSTNTWRVPTSKALSWSTQYWWDITVTDTSNSLTTSWTEGTFTTGVRQPATGSLYSTGAPDGQEFEPATGNYTTSATDAVVATVGPPLSVVRSYNSLDPRRDGMFGAGWSTRWDMKLSVVYGGVAQVTFPSGRQVKFAPDGGTAGTYQPPPGMYATLVQTRESAGGAATGWQLMDKSSTSFFFDLQGRLTRIADLRGRTQTLEYGADGKLSKVSGVGGRFLSFIWTGSHVIQVATNPVDSAPLTWTYTYEGDKLVNACQPGSTPQVPLCTTYEYTSGSQYFSAVRNSDPLGYWRLGEASGTQAADSGAQAGTATYAGVTLGQSGAVEASTDTSAKFSGTSTLTIPEPAVSQLSGAASVEAWFKTSQAGVIMSAGTDDSNALARSVIYVGSDGKLRGQFRPTTGTAAPAPITSDGVVNDGQWHHVVLTLANTTQEMFLDGQSVGTATGAGFGGWPVGARFGNGKLEGGKWPGGPASSQNLGFVGHLDEVALYDAPLETQDVTTHFAARSAAPHLMSKITTPSGRVWMQSTYDTANDRIKSYTNVHAGTWQLSSPVHNKSTGISTVTVTDPDKNSITYTYDAERGNRLVSRTDQLGKKTSFTYDTAGFPKTTTDPNDNTVTHSYDKRGNLISTATCRKSGSCQTAYAQYYLNTSNPLDPRNDRMIKERDARSASSTDNTYAWVSEFNEFGEQIKLISPTTTDFPSGRVVAVTVTEGTEPAVGGGATPAGLVATRTDPAGSVWRYAYTAAGDLAEQTDPVGLVVKLTYDAIGRLQTSTEFSRAHPEGVASTFGYDATGLLAVQTGAGVKNEVTGVTHTAQHRYTYNADGNTLTMTVADTTGGDPARVTTHTYDASGRLTSTTGPEGGVIRQSWNALGQVASTTDARGTVIENGYSKRGELITKTLKAWTGSPVNPQPAQDVVVEAFAYDPGGRLATRTDVMGRKTSFTYYTDNLPWQKIADDVKLNGSTTARDVVLEEHTYDAAGNPTKLVTGGNRLTADFVYDAAGMLTSQTVDPTGAKRKTAFMYDAAGNVIKSVLSGAGTTRTEVREYGYTKTGQINREVVENGEQDLISTLEYDDRGLVISTVDPRGHVAGADSADFAVTLRYDAIGRLVEATAPEVPVEKAGAATTARPTVRRGYNTAGEQTHQVDAEGRTVESAYDRAGRLISTKTPAYTPPGSSTALTPISHFAYDAAGQLIKTTDPRGYSRTFEFDALGRQVRITDPAPEGQQAGQWVNEFNLAGQQSAAVDPRGARTEATYDDLGRQITQTTIERKPASSVATTKLEYNDAGHLTKTTLPGNLVTNLTVNAVGEVTQVSDPLTNKTDMAYDLAGRLTKITDALKKVTSTDYDLAGRPTTVKDLDAAGAVLRTYSVEYDAVGNPIRAIDPAGHATRQTFDALNRPISLIEPVADGKTITTSFGYNAGGSRTRLTDGRGNATWTNYNSLGLVETVTESATTAHPQASDRTWTTIYNQGGLPVTTLQPGGVRIDRTFDHLGRLLTETGEGGGAATAERTFGYDLTGQPTTVGDLTLNYNDRGLPLTVTKNGTQESSFSYDVLGQLSQRTDAAGIATFTWDQAGRLATATDPVTGRTLTYGYDIADRLTSLTAKTSTGAAADSQALGYDDLDRLTSQTLKNAAGSQLAKITYGWDDNDRLTSKTVAGLAGAGTNTYSHDHAGRLTSWTRPDGTITPYEWDDAGNRTKAGNDTFAYDERNRLSSGAGSNYAYTPRGTLATETKDGQTTQLTFDAFDRLIADGDSLYSYDALDRVTSRIHGTRKQTFRYSGLGNDLAAISDASTSTFAAKYGRDASGDLLGMQEGTAAPVATLTDLHTDLVATFTTTTLATTASYGPFGEVVAQTGEKTSLGYQGEYTDPDTGKVNMHARWYQPGTGTFASRDSLTQDPNPSVQANRYTYANGTPLTGTDPTGHSMVGPNIPSAGISAGGAGMVYYSIGADGEWVGGGGSCWGYGYDHSGSWISCMPSFTDMHDGAPNKNWYRDNYILPSLPSFEKEEAKRVNVIDAGEGAGRPAPDGFWDETDTALQDQFRSMYRDADSIEQNEALWKYLKQKAAEAKRASSAAIGAQGLSGGQRKPGGMRAAGPPAQQDAGGRGSGSDPVANYTSCVKQLGESACSDIRRAAVMATAIRELDQKCMGRVVSSHCGTVIGILGMDDKQWHKMRAKWEIYRQTHPGEKSWLRSILRETFDFFLGDAERCVGGDGVSCVLFMTNFIPGGTAGRGGISFLRRVFSKFDEAADVAVAACRRSSFIPGTRVLMADGSHKRIENIRVGDSVTAVDPETGVAGGRRVSFLISSEGPKDLIEISIGGIDGVRNSYIVTATAEHLFWVPALYTWVKAADLRAGSRLRTFVGTEAQVDSVRRWTAGRRVHNLTVAGLHTYYVLAGDQAILVHNDSPCDEVLAAVWSSPNRTLSDAFRYHYEKHAKRFNKTMDEYHADAKAWLESNPASQRINSKLVVLADGTKAIKYTTPGGGKGGIIQNGKLISFWYRND